MSELPVVLALDVDGWCDPETGVCEVAPSTSSVPPPAVEPTRPADGAPGEGHEKSPTGPG